MSVIPLQIVDVGKSYWLQDEWDQYEWNKDHSFVVMISKDGWFICPVWLSISKKVSYTRLREATPTELVEAEPFYSLRQNERY